MAGKHVRGAKETADAFRAMARRNPLRGPINRAARKAARPLMAEMKSNLRPHRETGNLARSLAVKGAGPRTRSFKTLVGPRWPLGRHAHLLEFGFLHNSGVTVPGVRWMSRALESTRAQVEQIFGTEVGKEIEAAARKVAAKVR